MTAGTDRWTALLFERKHDLTELEEMLLKMVPYSVLMRVSAALNPVWTTYLPAIAKFLASSATHSSSAFILDVSKEESTHRLKLLLQVDQAANQSTITSTLKSFISKSQARKNADQNLSKGYLADLDDLTLAGLGERIGQSSTDWRLLCDALGFENTTCREIRNPYLMLKKWKTAYPKATLYRLYFEAAELEMKAVCRYLDAIPLEGIAREVPSQTKGSFFNNSATRYELMRLNELFNKEGRQIDWDKLAESKRSYIKQHNPGLRGFDVLWWSSSLTMFILLYELDNDNLTKSIIEKFKKEYIDGIFQHKSPGGITYDQILFLASSISTLKAGPQVQGSAHYFESVDVSVDTGELLKAMYPNMKFGSPLSFESFLLLYWQDPDKGANLDLRSFYENILTLLTKTPYAFNERTSNKSKALERFREAYEVIKPYRRYNEQLAIKNIEEEENKALLHGSNNNSESSLKVGQVEDKDSCVVCMDGKRQFVFIPCGHLACCINCIKDLANCPLCRTQIQQKVQVYSP